jgi:hypothetical protein
MYRAAARAAEVTGAFRTLGLFRTGEGRVKEKRPAESITYAETAYRAETVQPPDLWCGQAVLSELEGGKGQALSR